MALVVSAAIVGIILKFDKTEDPDELPTVNKPNFNKKVVKKAAGKIEKIFFACDAGMGLVMGVSLMKNKVEEAGLPVEVEHISVKNITEEPDLIGKQPMH